MNQINLNHHFVESKVVLTGAVAKVDPNRAKRSGARQPSGALDSSLNSLEQLADLKYNIYMKLKTIIHEAEEGGFWAEVPALPGCLTQGESLEKLKANLREAIELWLSIDS